MTRAAHQNVRIQVHQMKTYIFNCSCLLLIVFLSACAAVNPNPNTGLRTVDLLMQKGSCAEALRIAEPAAANGQPWAQYRMGMILIDERCPKPSDQGKAAVGWFKKAACYESKSAWERGSALAVGQTGFFDARTSSTNAARMLADIFNRANLPGASWYWINRAATQYDIDEPERAKLNRILENLEARMPPGLLAEAHKADLCSNAN